MEPSTGLSQAKQVAFQRSQTLSNGALPPSQLSPVLSNQGSPSVRDGANGQASTFASASHGLAADLASNTGSPFTRSHSPSASAGNTRKRKEDFDSPAATHTQADGTSNNDLAQDASGHPLLKRQKVAQFLGQAWQYGIAQRMQLRVRERSPSCLMPAFSPSFV